MSHALLGATGASTLRILDQVAYNNIAQPDSTLLILTVPPPEVTIDSLRVALPAWLWSLNPEVRFCSERAASCFSFLLLIDKSIFDSFLFFYFFFAESCIGQCQLAHALPRVQVVQAVVESPASCGHVLPGGGRRKHHCSGLLCGSQARFTAAAAIIAIASIAWRADAATRSERECTGIDARRGWPTRRACRAHSRRARAVFGE